MFKKTLITLLVFSLLIVFSTIILAESNSTKYDFGGRTVTFVEAGHLPIHPVKELEVMTEEEFKKIEEKYNVDIKFKKVPNPKYVDEVMSALMAGDNLGQILHLNDETFEILAAEKALYSLNEVLGKEYYNSLQPSHRDQIKIYGRLGDTQYGFCSNDLVHKNADVTNERFLVFNKNLLDKEGITSPYKLYDQGKWTWETFRSILKNITRDTDGDGKIDQKGLGAIGGPILRHSVYSFIASNGGSLTRVEDGKVKYALDEPKSVQALKYIAELIQNDYYEYTYGTKALFPFIKGELAFLLSLSGNMEPIYENMEDSYGYILMPKGPQGKDHTIISGITRFALSANIKGNPRAYIALANELFQITTNYRLAEKYMEAIRNQKGRFVRDRESLAMIDEMHRNWNPMKFGALFRQAGVWQPYIEEAFQGDRSVSSAVKAAKPVAQEMLNEVLNQ